MLGKIVAVSLLAISSGVVSAADWKRITGNDNIDLYFDASTVRRSGSKVKVWAILDYKDAQLSTDKVPFLSDRYLEEVDCAEEKNRTLTFAFLSGNMGKGTTVYSSDEVSKWRELVPDSFGRALMQAVCK